MASTGGTLVTTRPVRITQACRPPSHRAPSRPPSWSLTAASGALAGAVLAWVTHDGLADDAYITLSMARNVAEHGQWAVTPGLWSNTATSPLWVALLALPMLLVGPVVALGVWLVVLTAATSALVAWTSTRLGWAWWAGPLAAVGLAASPVMSSSVGLESALAVTLLAALLAAVVADRTVVAGVVCGLLVLTRPDLVVVAVVAAVWWTLSGQGNRVRTTKPRVLSAEHGADGAVDFHRYHRVGRFVRARQRVLPTMHLPGAGARGTPVSAPKRVGDEGDIDTFDRRHGMICSEDVVEFGPDRSHGTTPNRPHHGQSGALGDVRLPHVRHAGIIVLAALATVTPWPVLSLAWFGTLVPETLAWKTTQPGLGYHSIATGWPMLWALYPAATGLCLATFAAAGIASAWWAWTRPRHPVTLLAAVGAAHLVVLVVVLRAPAGFMWYLGPATGAAVIVLALTAARAPRLGWLPLGALIAAGALFVAGHDWRTQGYPWHANGALPAQYATIAGLVPDGASVATEHGEVGTIAFFCGDRCTVVDPLSDPGRMAPTVEVARDRSTLTRLLMPGWRPSTPAPSQWRTAATGVVGEGVPVWSGYSGPGHIALVAR